MFVNIDCGFFGCLFGLLLMYLLYITISSSGKRRLERDLKKQREKEKKELYEKYRLIIEKENKENAEKQISSSIQ